MSTHLETATLLGKRSAMPGVPQRDIKVDILDDYSALIIRAKNGSYATAIAFEFIKQSTPFSQPGGSVTKLSSALFTFGLWPSDDWFVEIDYYSADYDQDMALVFAIGNSSNGPLKIERRAVALAKRIWEIRADRLRELRNAMTIQFR